jgi:hypothetical protein
MYSGSQRSGTFIKGAIQEVASSESTISMTDHVIGQGKIHNPRQ